MMVMSNLLSAGLAVAGTLMVNRSQRTSSERDAFIVLQQDVIHRAEQIAEFKQSLEKLVTDVNRMGAALREIRTVLVIASQTGEMPRLGTSPGEGQKL